MFSCCGFNSMAWLADATLTVPTMGVSRSASPLEPRPATDMASLNPCAEMRSSIEPAAAVVRQHDAAVVAEEQRRRLSRRRCRHALGRRADGLEKNLAGLRRAGNR